MINPTVCQSVCLSVREHISGAARPIFTNFFCIYPVAMARSSHGGVAIRYVRPVLWMTSRLAVVGATPKREAAQLISVINVPVTVVTDH